VAVCVLNDKPNTMAAEFTINRARQVAVVDRIAEKGVKKSRSVRHPGKFYAGIQGDRRSHRFRPEHAGMTIRGSCEIHCMGLDSSFLHPLGGNEIEKGERVMNAKRWMTVVVCGCWMVSAALCLAAGAEETARPLLDKMLDAVMTNDYDSFVAEGTPEVKAGLTRQMLAGVNSQMAPRMKKGYDATYLGELKQQGCQVMLWKLTYKDGGDDTLARLALKEGKMAGFLLQ